MIKNYLYLKSEKKPRAREAPGGSDPSRTRERQGVDVSMIVVTISGMPRSFAIPLRRIFQTISDGFIEFAHRPPGLQEAYDGP